MTTSTSQSIATFAFRTGSLRALLVLCLLLILGSVMTSGWQVALKEEFGALELGSFVCLSAAALVSLSFFRQGIIKLWSVPAVYALLALREVDFQNWWFEPGLLRTAIFNAPVPLWHKMASGAVMLAVLVTLLSLIARGAKPVATAVVAGKRWAVTLLVSAFFVFAAIMLDGLAAKLAAINVTMSPTVAAIASYTEEIMEFGFAFTLVVSLVYYARSVGVKGHGSLREGAASTLGMFSHRPAFGSSKEQSPGK